jgi:predicted lipoprotein with Yx(FWY)xxD motif
VRRLLAIVVVVVPLALAACGHEEDGATTQAAPATTSTQNEQATSGDPATGTELVAGDSQYGSILFDSERQAIYLFDKESSAPSKCYGACAEAWPPVITEGEPKAGAGLDPKLVGTTERDDGSTQVTYNGHPLYYYVDDPPGEVLCHNVDEFGGLWLVVEPSGEAVQ